MSQSKPILQKYGPLHALSPRGLHVRESARSWKLVVPMPSELITALSGLCERLGAADAATLLLVFDGFARSGAERPEVCLQRALDAGGRALVTDRHAEARDNTKARKGAVFAKPVDQAHAVVSGGEKRRWLSDRERSVVCSQAPKTELDAQRGSDPETPVVFFDVADQGGRFDAELRRQYPERTL